MLAALTANARPILWLLLGTTGLVLLLACANVANLTLARMLRRDREFAMRAALGAGRGRLVRQLLAESTLLSMVAGVVGLAFAWDDAGRADPVRQPIHAAHRCDRPRPVGAALHAGASPSISGLVFGLVPALSTRSDVLQSLKQGSLGSGVSAGRRRVQDGLVVAQVAVSVVLLVGASLLLASVWRLQRVDSGYRADRVLAATVFGNFSKYPDVQSQLRLYEPLVERLNQLPGVESAAITNAVPLVLPEPQRDAVRHRGPHLRSGAPPARRRPHREPALLRDAGHPGAGRDAPSPTSITASRSASWSSTRRWSATGTAAIRSGRASRPTTARRGGRWSVWSATSASSASIATPCRRHSSRWPRCRPASADGSWCAAPTDPTTLARAMADAVHALDPDMPVEDVQTLEEARDESLADAAPDRAAAGDLRRAGDGGDAGRRHRRDRRQRLAAHARVRRADGAGRHARLGADDGAEAGTGAGRAPVSCSAWSPPSGLSSALSAYLFDTPPRDPLVLLAVAAIFLIAGVLACLGPARRATGVDPLVALRAE